MKGTPYEKIEFLISNHIDFSELSCYGCGKYRNEI